jgi:hypothetical protein
MGCGVSWESLAFGSGGILKMFSGAIDWIARQLAASAGTTKAQSAGAWFPAVAGVDAIVAIPPASLDTATVSPFEGARFAFEAAGANTGPVTLEIQGWPVYPVVHLGGAAMVAGDIPAAGALVEVWLSVDHGHWHTQLIRQPSAVAPLMAGIAAIGTSTRFARGDHVHPTDTSRAPSAAIYGGMTLTANLTPAAATFTKMSCSADAGGNSGIAFDDATDTLTIVSGGLYEFVTDGYFSSSVTAPAAGLVVPYVNGAAIATTTRVTASTTGYSRQNTRVVRERLAADDAITLYGYATAASCIFSAAETRVMLRRIGD